MEYKKIKNLHSSDVRIEHSIGANWVMDYYHFHNVYEVYLALTEGGEFWIGNQQYVLAPNDLLLLSTSDFHRSIIHDKKKYERYILYFDPFYISSMNTNKTNLLNCFARRKPANSHRIALKSEEAGKLVSLFQELSTLLSEKCYAADVKVKIQLAQILIYIDEVMHQQDPKLEQNEISHASYPIIKPVMNYIDANYPHEITTDEAADMFGINRHQMNALFRDITGLSFHQYLVRFRVIKAKEMLECGNVTTTQACFESGFNDYSHFIRTFKAMVGVPPGKYARNFAGSKIFTSM